ncbi:MAG: nucleotidyltransferase domain-containing protein [Candidatus Vogelbacteria bacterium]|nr:nucleotidyltransferase domain-containing protein [Candidatus Vogelbacteria bacterium]
MELEVIKPKVAVLAEKYGLDFVVLYGSQATGKTHAKSDVDVGVISQQSFDLYRLMMDLSAVFKRPNVEVVDLATASPTLSHAIVRDGKLLYENPVGSFSRWKVYATKIWMETRWLRDRRDQKLINWARKHERVYAN